MKKIVIVAKVSLDSRAKPVGLDGGVNFFKKSLSRSLSDNLNERLIEENMDYQADVDQTYDSLEDLIRNGADLVLISPYIRDNISTENLDEANYYMLNEQEFLDGEVDNIISRL